MIEVPTVAIACQGGGSHAAFTAGVLQTLLREEAGNPFTIVGFSGTSGGAISALLAWYGLLTGGAETGIALLGDLWRENAAASPYEQLHNAWTLAAARSQIEVKGSPYEFPLSWAIRQQRTLAQMQTSMGLPFLRETYIDLPSLLEKFVVFEPGPAPRRVVLDHPPVRETRLVIGAVEILSGEFETFDSDDRDGSGDSDFDSGGISLEAVLASAALPAIFRAVRIGERAYWDGLFSQNPPIRDFIAGSHVRTAAEKPDQIWVIQINPQTGDEPTTPYEIEDRRNELAGNLSLNQEIRAIRTFNNTVRQNLGTAAGNRPAAKQATTLGGQTYKIVDVHRIRMDRQQLARETGRKLDVASKLDRSAPFIESLIRHGQERAAEFLAAWRAGTLTSET
jgi:NTE family protein